MFQILIGNENIYLQQQMVEGMEFLYMWNIFYY